MVSGTRNPSVSSSNSPEEQESLYKYNNDAERLSKIMADMQKTTKIDFGKVSPEDLKAFDEIQKDLLLKMDRVSKWRI